MTKYHQISISTFIIAVSFMLVACGPAQEAQDTATATAAEAKTVVAAATTEPEAPPAGQGMGAGNGGMAMGDGNGGMGAAMGGGRNAFPPPAPLDGRTRDQYVPEGTMSSDGIGVTVRPAPTAEPYTEENVTYVLWEDGSVIKPLEAGTPLPMASTVFQKSGEKFDLNAAATEKPTVLIYYRGGWCPFCNAHLRDLQESLPALQEMGYQLLAVSTDTVEALNEYDDSEFNYQLFADPDLDLATKLGIKYKLVQEYIDHVSALPGDRAFDVEERNGGYMVTPAAFILDTNGVVRFSYANNNYAVRVSQEAMLAAAKEALQ